MVGLVVLIALLMVTLGIAIMINPEGFRHGFYWFLDPRNIYPVAAIRIAAGVAFIFASPYLFLPTLIAGLGVVFIAAGIVVPCLGRARLEAMEQWWLTVPTRVLRTWGFVSTVGGALVLWAWLKVGF